VKLQISYGALRNKPTSEATDWVLSRLGIGHKPADANVAQQLDRPGSSYDQPFCMAALYGSSALFFFVSVMAAFHSNGSNEQVEGGYWHWGGLTSQASRK
jgi:hypothetical protein